MPENSFEALVNKAFIDTAAFEALRQRIYVLQRHMGNHDHAEDATQEILITVWQKYKIDIRDRSCLEDWVLKIAHNKAIDYLRQKRPHPSLDKMDDDDEAPLSEFLTTPSADDMPEEFLERQEFNQLVWQALEELPVKRRSCLVLRLALGVETSKIARLHNLCDEQVRRLIRQGREEFKTAYTRLVSEQQIKERGQGS